MRHERRSKERRSGKGVAGFFLVSGAFAIAMAGSLVAFGTMVSSVVENEARITLSSNLERKADALSSWTRNNQDVLARLAAIITDSGRREDAETRFLDAADDVIEAAGAGSNEVYDIYFAPAKKPKDGGKAWFWSKWNYPDDYDWTERPWYKGAIEAGGFRMSPPYVDLDTGKLIFTLSVTVSVNGVKIGVVAEDLFMTKVNEIINELAPTSSASVFLVDPDGRYVTGNAVMDRIQATRKEWTETAPKNSSLSLDDVLDREVFGRNALAEEGVPSDAIDLLSRGSGATFFDHARGKYFAVANVPGLPWKLFAVGPIGEAMANWYGIMSTLAAIGVISMALVAFVMVALARTTATRERAAAHAAFFREHAAMADKAAEDAKRVKNEFLANISHELRTPLNSIINFAFILGLDAEQSGKKDQSELTAKIERAGRKLLDLIDTLLDISKLDSGKVDLRIEPVDLKRLAEPVFADFAKSLEGRPVAFESSVSPGLRPLRGDASRIRQVLLNLLSNASKFTESGRISVRANDEWDSTGKRYAKISVEDTGIGMKPESIPATFAEFVQLDASLDRQAGGTGLGLSIAKKIVELHEGRIGVESVLGEGSTFWFEIPTWGD